MTPNFIAALPLVFIALDQDAERAVARQQEIGEIGDMAAPALDSSAFW
jgi:hypothetical protein